MIKICYKWFWAWDFEREEKWLNEMAAKGLSLRSVGFCRYEFEPCEPGEYQFRLELLEHTTTHIESEQYISFLEDTGVKHVGTFGRWIFLRKKTDGGTFDLFSDYQSRITHLNRILLMIGIVAGFNLFAGINNLAFYFGLQDRNAIGFVNLLLAGMILYGFVKTYAIKHRLQKEQQLFE